MEYFEIKGGRKLKGEISVNSSKNATVALLMGALINKGKTTLKNVPQIEEVNRLMEVLESVGVKFVCKKRDITILPPKKINIENIDKKAAKKTRSIILMVGALAGSLKKYSIPQAGGCRLGSRTIMPHLFGLEKLGIEIKTASQNFQINIKKLKPAKKIVLYEKGDTVTENILFAAAQAPGKTEIKLASANYMVQDVCFFLEKLGVEIKGIGTETLEIKGKPFINKDVSYEISEDPIEAMFFISLAVATKSEILIKRCPIDFLELELLKLEKMGFKYEIVKEYKSKNKRTNLVDIKTLHSNLKALEEKIHPLPSTGINIDNLPFFVPVAISAKGKTLLHDWVYEGRSGYFKAINKLGSKIKLLDEHRVEITGPSKLSGNKITCPPALRPAAIILVAMLSAKGESLLKDIYSIKRGYENLEERLQKLGANIKRVVGF